ncbi:MAG: ribosomal protein S18-alanine N-acetyltransferase [Chloroflexi bacterium]|nr:ribosomal protein S18-alanine N-acetyltransferase [Chloroflexota bacterium]
MLSIRANISASNFLRHVLDMLLLRPMTLKDVDEVTALDQRAFGESGWSRRHFVGEISDSPISIFYVLTDSAGSNSALLGSNSALLGYFGTWHIVDQLQLCTFAVDPERHGQGLGAILLNCVFRLAQRLECEVIQLEVRESNVAARTLYRSRGFQEEAVRRNLYSKPNEDGILMSIETPSASFPGASDPAGLKQPQPIELRWNDRAGASVERWP